MEIVKKKTSEISPYWRNPRKNEKAVDAVIKSIKEYGYINPIVVDDKGVIITGHTRFKALSILGHTEIDVIIAKMTPQKAKEYRIIDNKTSELASWDMNLLLPELREFENLKEFTIFFPELKLEESKVQIQPVQPLSFNQPAGVESKGAVDYVPPQPNSQGVYGVSDEDIAKREAELNSQFSNMSESMNERIRTITCPHCGGNFDTRFAMS